jgi:hypothetical protein
VPKIPCPFELLVATCDKPPITALLMYAAVSDAPRVLVSRCRKVALAESV